MRVLSHLTLTILILGIFSCSKDSATLDLPEFYTFSRDGQSTVNFEGQTTRIRMAEELSKSLLDFTMTEERLLDMFSNTNMPFSTEDLNQSNKSIKSKVAASFDYFNSNSSQSSTIRNQMEDWIVLQVKEIGTKSEQLASRGSSGQLIDGTSVRYVGDKGLEYNQAVIKGLIGALILDQTVNNYLSPSVLDAGTNIMDNNSKTNAEGKPYTNMEHKWDEAYGYVFGKSVSPSDPLSTLGGDDSFFNKYLGRVEKDPDFSGIAKDIFEAFKTGRAAIVAGDYEKRDEQIILLQGELSKVIAVRSIYYLQQGKRALEEQNFGTAFHDLSEGLGFIYSLQFTRIPGTQEAYFDYQEVDKYLEDLLEGNGFWDLDAQTLDSISIEIAERFELRLEEAAG